MDTHPHFETRIDPTKSNRSIADELLLSTTTLLVLVAGFGAATLAASALGSTSTIAAVGGLVAGIGVPAAMLLVGAKLNAAIGGRTVRRIGGRERADQHGPGDRTGDRDEPAGPAARTTGETAGETGTTVLTFAEIDEVGHETAVEGLQVVDRADDSEPAHAEC